MDTTIRHGASVRTDDYDADGIRVERYICDEAGDPELPPLVLVHGGTQGAWAWEDFAPVLARYGFEVHALNWLGRRGSAEIPVERLLRLSIADVVQDIRKVASRLRTAPILVGHSMGGMAAQLYAQDHPVEALLLLAPVVPKEACPTPVAVPVDLERLWEPPSNEMAMAVFFDGLSPEACVAHLARIVPESPLRCYEATRFTLGVDTSRIDMPVMVVSGSDDTLTPPDTGEALAKLYGGGYRILHGVGHNILLGERAIGLARDLAGWLRDVSAVRRSPPPVLAPAFV